MARQTSITAYRAIQNNGLLSKMRWKVYETLYHHGPLTGHELDAWTKGDPGSKTSWHKRLSELERTGCVRCLPERKCTITGQLVHEWDVTDVVPVKVKKKRAKHPPRIAETEALLAVQDLLSLIKIGQKHGYAAWSPEFHKLALWLAHAAGCPACRKRIT